MLAEKGLGGTFRNLFRYVVMGDESVGAGDRAEELARLITESSASRRRRDARKTST